MCACVCAAASSALSWVCAIIYNPHKYLCSERFRSKHLLAYMQNEVGQHAHACSHIHMHVNINFKQLWCTGTTSLSLFHNSISLFGFGHILKMPEVILCVWVRKRKRQGNDIELCIVACFQLAQKNVTLSLENQQHEKKKCQWCYKIIWHSFQSSQIHWFPSHLWPIFHKCFFYI